MGALEQSTGWLDRQKEMVLQLGSDHSDHLCISTVRMFYNTYSTKAYLSFCCTYSSLLLYGLFFLIKGIHRQFKGKKSEIYILVHVAIHYEKSTHTLLSIVA